METGGTIKRGRVKHGGLGRARASLAWFLLITPTKFSLSSALALFSRKETRLRFEAPKGRPCAISVSSRHVSLANEAVPGASKLHRAVLDFNSCGFDSRLLLSSRGSRLARTLCGYASLILKSGLPMVIKKKYIISRRKILKSCISSSAWHIVDLYHCSVSGWFRSVISTALVRLH